MTWHIVHRSRETQTASSREDSPIRVLSIKQPHSSLAHSWCRTFSQLQTLQQHESERPSLHCVITLRASIPSATASRSTCACLPWSHTDHRLYKGLEHLCLPLCLVKPPRQALADVPIQPRTVHLIRLVNHCAPATCYSKPDQKLADGHTSQSAHRLGEWPGSTSSGRC